MGIKPDKKHQNPTKGTLMIKRGLLEFRSDVCYNATSQS